MSLHVQCHITVSSRLSASDLNSNSPPMPYGPIKDAVFSSHTLQCTTQLHPCKVCERDQGLGLRSWLLRWPDTRQRSSDWARQTSYAKKMHPLPCGARGSISELTTVAALLLLVLGPLARAGTIEGEVKGNMG